MRRVAILSSILAGATLLACGGSDSSSGDITGTNFNCTQPTNGTFSATVAGTSWAACQLVSVHRDSSGTGQNMVRSIGIAGTGAVSGSLTYAIVISVSSTSPLSTGTINLSTAVPTLGIISVGASNSAGWSSGFNTGSGSITITTLTSNHITGTFTADAAPATGPASGTLQIRNGKFDLSY